MPIRMRQTVYGRSIRRTSIVIGRLWLEIERRWEENPGYVAATTAGLFGILLALLLIISAGIDWINGPPEIPSPTVVKTDLEDDLGDPDTNIMRGLRSDDDPFDRFAMRDEADDERTDEPPDDDPFLTPRKFSRDADDDDEPKIVKTPARRKFIEEDDSEDWTPEPSKPGISRGVPKIEFEPKLAEKQTPAEEDEQPEPARHVAATEPVLLKTNGEREDEIKKPRDRIEADDDAVLSETRPARQPAPEHKPELHRARTELPATREHPGWQQQRTRTDAPRGAESPRASATRSRSSETVVVAPREVPRTPARRTVATPAPRDVRPSQKPAVEVPFKFEISGPAKVGLNESCSYILTLTNTGTTAARNLVVSIELPPGLVHEVSQSLEQKVASVPPGGSHRSLLKLRAKQPGQSTILAEIVDGNRVAVKLTAHVQVGTAAQAGRVVMSDGLCDDLR
ncbi:MAG: DUF11 domain-containing protein [Planctomycetia bacterium]|nr:DUF11 domain-containing protein [Planctomycetia bacterium]